MISNIGQRERERESNKFERKYFFNEKRSQNNFKTVSENINIYQYV